MASPRDENFFQLEFHVFDRSFSLASRDQVEFVLGQFAFALSDGVVRSVVGLAHDLFLLANEERVRGPIYHTVSLTAGKWLPAQQFLTPPLTSCSSSSRNSRTVKVTAPPRSGVGVVRPSFELSLLLLMFFSVQTSDHRWCSGTLAQRCRRYCELVH